MNKYVLKPIRNKNDREKLIRVADIIYKRKSKDIISYDEFLEMLHFSEPKTDEEERNWRDNRSIIARKYINQLFKEDGRACRLFVHNSKGIKSRFGKDAVLTFNIARLKKSIYTESNTIQELTSMIDSDAYTNTMGALMTQEISIHIMQLNNLNMQIDMQIELNSKAKKELKGLIFKAIESASLED